MAEREDGGDDWRPNASLGNALPVMLLRAREAVMQLYRPLFRSAGLTERQWRVLRALYDADRLEPSELARQAFMHPPNVSRVLNEMRMAGYLDRLAVDGDQRRAQVVLTPAGRRLCMQVGAALDARTAQLRQVVDRPSLLALTELLGEIVTLPERHPYLTDPDSLPGAAPRSTRDGGRTEGGDTDGGDADEEA
ncbi:MarR family transcriptional regulator [Marinibaculum pumilum]|uniref:MarR family transcriptional regulator n=1 Tax=Marinibaculum pumilum TaxID=1766165 RepID=A0ABV7L1P4_9PROT